MTSETGDTEVAVCRACINECTEYKSLHKQGIFLGEVQTLASMLSFLTNIEFRPEDSDGFPPQICVRCVQALAKAFAFKKMVLESAELLRRAASGAEGMCDVEGESAASVMEEEQQQYETEEIVADDGELQGLATAAQYKRDLDQMEYDSHEYVTVTVLEDENIHEQKEQHTLEHVVDEDEEVEVHEVEEGDELYQAEGSEPETKYELSMRYYEESLPDAPDAAASENVRQEHSEEAEVENKAEKESGNELYEYVKGEAKGIVPAKSRKKSAQAKPHNPDLQCQVCGKQLSNQNSFKYHMQLHSDATPYLCSLCGEGFKTRNAYEGHIVIHDPNNPNTCELCGKSYRQSSSLRTHMLTHTGERPFQCDICGKAMTQKSGYKKHMLVHTGEKPHVCDVCGREFRYSSNLIAHKRCHSGEKPYECPHCKKGFPTSEQMKRHAMVHTGERPFPCEICHKRFKRRSSLLAHRHTHDSEPEQLVTQKVSRSNVVELY